MLLQRRELGLPHSRATPANAMVQAEAVLAEPQKNPAGLLCSTTVEPHHQELLLLTCSLDCWQQAAAEFAADDW